VSKDKDMTDKPKAAPAPQHQDDPTLSRDATHSTYAPWAAPEGNPPPGPVVEQELGVPVDVDAPDPPDPPVRSKD
jgi:hypothetical protein